MTRNEFDKWKQDILDYMKYKPEDPDVNAISDLFFRKFKSDKFGITSLDQRFSNPLKMAGIIIEAYYDQLDSLFLCSRESGIKLIHFALLVIHCVDTLLYKVEHKYISNNLKFNVMPVYINGHGFANNDKDIFSVSFSLFLVSKKPNWQKGIGFEIYWECDRYNNIKRINNYSNMLDVPVQVWIQGISGNETKRLKLAELPTLMKNMLNELIDYYNKA